jgi:hypothetical protein
MAHPIGETLRCDDCGAEVVYIKACNCPKSEQKTHSDTCCGKEMRSLGVTPQGKATATAAQSPSAQPRM